MDVPGPVPGAEGTEGVAVTPHLLNLDGTPLTWAELHARNEEWWRLHGPDGYTQPVSVLPERVGLSMTPGAIYKRVWRARKRERLGRAEAVQP